VFWGLQRVGTLFSCDFYTVKQNVLFFNGYMPILTRYYSTDLDPKVQSDVRCVCWKALVICSATLPFLVRFLLFLDVIIFGILLW